MRHLNYALIAALAFLLPAQVHAGDGGYLQASWTVASMDDASASYRGEASQSFGLDDGDAYSASLGYGFMDNFAVELKLNYVEGAVDSIAGETTRAGSSYNYAAATLGLLYRHRLELEKGSDFAVIPYIGVAAGYDGGYMDVQKDSEGNCGPGENETSPDGDCASGDNRHDYGSAVRGSIGGLIELHDNIGIDLNYDYIWGTIADNHFGSAGLRIMF